MTAVNQLGYQKLTVTTAAIGLTMPTVNSAVSRPRRALIFCGPVAAAATNYVFWRADGTDPTNAEGMPLQVGDYLDLTAPDDWSDFYGVLSRIKFFLASGAAADATLYVHYFGG